MAAYLAACGGLAKSLYPAALAGVAAALSVTSWQRSALAWRWRMASRWQRAQNRHGAGVA
jgi:hypothetical protein